MDSLQLEVDPLDPDNPRHRQLVEGDARTEVWVDRARDAAAIVGVILVAVGAWWIYPPLALIFLGTVLILVAWLA